MAYIRCGGGGGESEPIVIPEGKFITLSNGAIYRDNTQFVFSLPTTSSKSDVVFIFKASEFVDKKLTISAGSTNAFYISIDWLDFNTNRITRMVFGTLAPTTSNLVYEWTPNSQYTKDGIYFIVLIHGASTSSQTSVMRVEDR